MKVTHLFVAVAAATGPTQAAPLDAGYVPALFSLFINMALQNAATLPRL
jgi:hypothetical protein